MRELALPQPKPRQQTSCMLMMARTLRDHAHRVKTVSSLKAILYVIVFV